MAQIDSDHLTLDPARIPGHVAIVMDGNGRWAQRRGLPRAMGHRSGVEALRRTVRAAGDIGIRYLTLFGFSSENWRRPAQEIDDLMGLLRRFVRQDLAELHRNNVRVRVIGDEDRLDDDVVRMITEAQQLTRHNTALDLIVAFNYGARSEIAKAARRISRAVQAGELTADSITEETVATYLDTGGIPDPDLFVRTSGEQRISNFLLYQLAYTELVFTDVLWPEFGEVALRTAIAEYQRRERRFGAVSARSAV